MRSHNNFMRSRGIFTRSRNNYSDKIMIITLRKSEDFSQSILVTAVCLSVCLSVFLSLNDVQATILMQSSWFLYSRFILVWEPWQNFFLEIGQVNFFCCHGNQSLNDERWGFFNILIFYFSAISRDIALKFIQDTYMLWINSQKNNWPLQVKGQGRRDGI